MNLSTTAFAVSIDSVATWILEHGIYFPFVFLGLLMGIIFFVSWRGSSTKEISFKNDSRVKALLYGLGGFFTTLIADWKALLGGDVDKKQLLILYGVSFGIVALLGPLVMFGFIWLKLELIKRRKPEECPGQPFYFALDYLIYGYRYHREELERLAEAARERRAERRAEIYAAAATNLAALLLSPTTSVQDVLKNMCQIFKSHIAASEIPDVNANLMVSKPYSEATPEQLDRLKFKFGDESRYGSLLYLTDYAYDKGEERIALPVEDSNRTPDWLNIVLLGAPEAFLRKRETVVNTRKLDFATKIPKTVREDMTQYFKGKGFKSFACLTVISEGSVIGIVNIESSHELVSDTIQVEVAKILQPFCAVISLILVKRSWT